MMRSNLACALTLLAPWTPAAAAQSEEVLNPPFSADGLEFGFSLGTDGQTIAVGTAQNGAGFVNHLFLFERTASGFAQIASFDAEDFGGFQGNAVAWGDVGVFGDTVVSVGSNGYVTRRINGVWQADQIIGASGHNTLSRVDVEADVFAVTNGVSGVGIGADVYRRSGSDWVPDGFALVKEVLLTGNPGVTELGVFDDRLVTGHSFQNLTLGGNFTQFVGDAFVSRRDPTGWILEQELVPSLRVGSGEYGRSVDLEGSIAVVSAWKQPAGGQVRAGRVYVFERTGTTWTETQVLQSDAPTFNERFGAKVELEGNRLVVSAPRNDELGGGDDTWDNGAFYVFERQANGAFVQTAKVFPTDSASGDRLGEDGFSFRKGTLVAGAWRRDTPKPDSGVVLAIDLSTDATVYCSGKLSSTGCVPVVDYSGSPSAALDIPFLVEATDVVNLKNGLLFYGLSGAASIPFQGGTLCVVPPLRRATLQNSGGTPPPTKNCTGSFQFDVNDWIQSGIDAALVPGQQVNGQFWFRDPPSVDGSGLSNGIEFTVGL